MFHEQQLSEAGTRMMLQDHRVQLLLLLHTVVHLQQLTGMVHLMGLRLFHAIHHLLLDLVTHIAVLPLLLVVVVWAEVG